MQAVFELVPEGGGPGGGFGGGGELPAGDEAEALQAEEDIFQNADREENRLLESKLPEDLRVGNLRVMQLRTWRTAPALNPATIDADLASAAATAQTTVRH